MTQLSPRLAQPDLDSDDHAVTAQYARLYEYLRKRVHSSDFPGRSDDWRLDHAADVAGWFTEDLGDVIEKGEISSSLFADLMQITPLLEGSDPALFYRRGLVLLSAFESVYFEGHIEYAPVYRALMKLDREIIAMGNFDATTWFAKLQSVMIGLRESGDPSSMASLKAWRDGLSARYTRKDESRSAVLNSLYTLNYYGNPGLAEEFYDVILPHVRDERRMAAIIPLLLAATASQDFTRHPLGSLIWPTSHIISTAEFVDSEYSADLQGIVQSVTMLLGYAATNLATAQTSGISPQIQRKLAEDIRSLLAKDKSDPERPEYTLRTDAAAPSQVRRELDVVARILGDPRHSYFVASATKLDDLIKRFDAQQGPPPQEEARLSQRRRARRSGPARAHRIGSAAAHTRRSVVGRAGLSARMARHLA